MIDISLKLEKDHEVWKWLKKQENTLISAGHIGTHIDVYKKTSIPEEYIKRTGVLIDCSSISQDIKIDLNILNSISIQQGDFVIFKTNIQKNNPYGSNTYINKHHQLSWNLINFLIEKKVSFIGIDCAGIRRGKEHFQADIKAEKNKTYIIENLDLTKLKYNHGNHFDVLTVWIDNPFSTGLSTRVFIKEKVEVF